MDQIKIGKFIAECRKKNNLTQMQLAEKLNITDRAISKWENGKGMPDSSIMLDLCNELKISVNELLSGEVIKMNTYNEKLEQNLIDMVKQKEESDKRLLTMEIAIGALISIVFFALIFIASFVKMEDWLRATLIITGFIPLNLIKIIFLQHNLLIYLFVILYCISIVTYFVLRYKKYNQRKNRIELFHRYGTSIFNKYIPDWSIWLIGIILCPAGGFFMVWVQKNLLCYLL